MLIKDIVEIIDKLEAEGKPEDQQLIDFYKLAIHEVLNEVVGQQQRSTVQ